MPVERPPYYGDGSAAERIAEAVAAWREGRRDPDGDAGVVEDQPFGVEGEHGGEPVVRRRVVVARPPVRVREAGVGLLEPLDLEAGART